MLDGGFPGDVTGSVFYGLDLARRVFGTKLVGEKTVTRSVECDAWEPLRGAES